MSQVQQESDQGLRSSLMRQMAEGREQLDRSAFEACFQIFTNALHRCETIPALEPLKYQVLGNIGWANRLVGRYKIAADTLQEALALADAAGAATQAAMARAQIEAELGTVFRMMNCHEDAREAFSRQYSISVSRQREYWGWKRVRCRAIGNLGMANYQRAIQLLSQSPDDPGIQKKTRDRIDEAISQLEERISLADDIYEDDLGWGHGAASRTYQAESWACIGLSRLSLCYTAISDLGPKEGKSYWMDKAVKTAKKGAERAVGARNSARSLSRFFYGRALLRSADEDNEPVLKEKALELFNNTTQVPKIASAAIALAMEPSTEHRGYLRELVSVGADLTSLDPDTGYTALDYAVFSGDEEAEAIIVEGLCQQLSSTGKDVGNQATTQALVEQQRTEARLRKGYREMFQERLRPILLKSYNRWRDWQYGSEGVQAALARETITTMKRIYGDGVTADRATLNEMFDQFRRRDTVLALRTAYARALAVDGNAAGTMFDQLRAVRYSDFAAFGRLPRSSDGLAKPLMGYNSIEPGDGKRSVGVGGGDEFIIFFSYRWINHDPGANSPDDANRTQYKRMVDAVESYIAHKETPDIPPEKLYIWMDFACVDQDNPTTGVSALPLIIAQCDAVITLRDDDYFERAWCCVEALITSTLRDDYHVNAWFEQVPACNGDGAAGSAASTSLALPPLPGGPLKEPRRWQLRYTEPMSKVALADTKLTHESDRPKVMFLERQSKLLSRENSGLLVRDYEFDSNP